MKLCITSGGVFVKYYKNLTFKLQIKYLKDQLKQILYSSGWYGLGSEQKVKKETVYLSIFTKLCLSFNNQQFTQIQGNTMLLLEYFPTFVIISINLLLIKSTNKYVIVHF